MFRRWSVRGDTSRNATLNGTLTTAQSCTLGDLRAFVKALEQWPDRARVNGHAPGCVMQVSTRQAAEPFATEDQPNRGDR